MIEDEDIEIEDTQREDRHDLMMQFYYRNLYCRRCSHS